MKIISTQVSLDELREMANKNYNRLVKAVVDIDKKIMAVDADLHADEEKLLLENGSKQESLWGINIFPEEAEDERIEYDSMINIRPFQDNRTRDVENADIRERIKKIVQKLINK
ncbi:hypothetical protein A3D78_07570 [Candidatus Gottesmanbacteria bacterium RIFCSPHIGHO2_02_FULL_39_14]|uniref:Uncharacterized protein n=1 Tax=Candidatus Gottesmanbacteria bacterium RIFCSPHIGHO2_02_FULL_39_14 TaxID=1798383 RepID=A0A1F6A2W1_9BACT|nr:MAG: hypothetical protein A3D78_07570 [Candidatus Gottesmanbacteria bacterium RIFCSPHIGHO2_02_FULL_39_14]